VKISVWAMSGLSDIARKLTLARSFFFGMVDTVAYCGILSTTAVANIIGCLAVSSCTRSPPGQPIRAATSSMKTVSAFTTASFDVFEERFSAVPTHTQGVILATGRLGFATGCVSSRVSSALRFARL
jgi:hypothetical protein